MNQQPIVSLNASGGALLWNLTQLVFEHRQLLQLSRKKEEEEAYFVDYIPPARDAITLPRNVVYVLVGVVLVIVATYAIVGHLIKDLMHDFAGNPPETSRNIPSQSPLLSITLSVLAYVFVVSLSLFFLPEFSGQSCISISSFLVSPLGWLCFLMRVSFTSVLWFVCRGQPSQQCFCYIIKVNANSWGGLSEWHLKGVLRQFSIAFPQKVTIGQAPKTFLIMQLNNIFH